MSPIFAFITFAIAFSTAHLINLRYKIARGKRYENIDGLKGFLAIGVFISHAAIWRKYLATNIWQAPQSNLYSHLGETSVCFFFMITAFLFMSKLLNQTKIDWRDLFVSRLFRLVPMYLASVSVLIVLVFVMTEWQVNVTALRLVKNIFFWATFTIISAPEINAYPETWLINAGVVWSMPLEWLWYFSLPLVSFLILRKKTPILYLALSLSFIIFYWGRIMIYDHFVLSFAGGAIAPFILKYRPVRSWYNSKAMSVIIVVLLCLLGQFHASDVLWSKILTIIIFNLIALGNDLFGLLKNSALRLLGAMCFSTYLLHGIILFVTMNFILGLDHVKATSLMSYWLIIFTVTPVVVVLSFLGFKYIEEPFMTLSRRFKSSTKTTKA